MQGQELARLEVEVPAGGARAYEVVVAPPVDQRVVLLRVIPDGGAMRRRRSPRLSSGPRVAAKEILVGLVGLPRLEQVLGEVRSAVSGEPITPVGMDAASERLERGGTPSALLSDERPTPTPAGGDGLLAAGGRAPGHHRRGA